MVATMLGNCFLSAAAVYLIADVGERQQVAVPVCTPNKITAVKNVNVPNFMDAPSSLFLCARLGLEQVVCGSVTVCCRGC
jgi:hypothetical protein